MAEIKLVRIDSRLIHGQVASQWTPKTAAKSIVIIDDATAADSFMSEMLQLACPRNVDVIVYGVEKGVAQYKADKFGNGNVIVLFQNVDNCYRAFKAGFDFTELNIAQIPAGPGRVRLPGTTINMNKSEMSMVEEICNSGVECIMQMTPNESRTPLLPIIQRSK